MGISQVAILKASADFPTGRRLAQLLSIFFRRQFAQVMAWVKKWLRNDMIATRLPDLSSWTEPMADAGGDLLLPAMRRGGNEAERRIRLVLPGDMLPQRIFASIHPKVQLATSRLALNFCEETNATSTMRLSDALDATRKELFEGLELGEAIPKLGARIAKIFKDPLRAYTIARTESARAMMAGQTMVAQESGIVIGMKWLASTQACPRCKSLNGKVVKFGEPFSTDGGKGVYASVWHPPLHPH